MSKELLSAFGAATLLGKDRQTIVRALRNVDPDGHERGHPRWRLPTILKALETARAGAASRDAGLSQARAELAREQTAAVALKNAIVRGELVHLPTVQKSLETVFVAFRERMLSTPGKIAASCEMRSRADVEAIVREELCECLQVLSEMKTAAERSRDEIKLQLQPVNTIPCAARQAPSQ